MLAGKSLVMEKTKGLLKSGKGLSEIYGILEMLKRVRKFTKKLMDRITYLRAILRKEIFDASKLSKLGH